MITGTLEAITYIPSGAVARHEKNASRVALSMKHYCVRVSHLLQTIAGSYICCDFYLSLIIVAYASRQQGAGIGDGNMTQKVKTGAFRVHIPGIGFDVIRTVVGEATHR